MAVNACLPSRWRPVSKPSSRDRPLVESFFLSVHASNDLDEIERYLDELPREVALRIAHVLLQTLLGIGDQPYLGTVHSTLTRILEVEVRSRLAYPYRLYYRVGEKVPEIIAILHTGRDTLRSWAHALNRSIGPRRF